MTSTILVVVVAAGIAAYTLSPHHHPAPPPPKSAAETATNGTYFYRKGWHTTHEALPMGNRAGAGSYPYTTPLHWELPDRSNAPYLGDPSMSGYYQMHEHSDSGFLTGNRHAYTGDVPLPAGTWTGEPLAPYSEYHHSTWRRDVNGAYRKDEVSGQALIVNTPQPAPGTTPKNP